MESIGRTVININKKASSEQKARINNIFNEVYNNSSFIKHIDNDNYQGDMGCLCVLGTRVVRHLMKDNLLPLITSYDVININTKERESLLEDG